MQITLPDTFLLAFVAQSRNKKLNYEAYVEDLLQQLHTRIAAQPDFLPTLEDKVTTSELIIAQAIEQFGVKQSSVAWTGGKDSTFILWLVQRVLKKLKKPWPKVMVINEGDMFEEVVQFIKQLSKDWEFEYEEVKNEDVFKQRLKMKDKRLKKEKPMIQVSKLNERNRKELKRLGFRETKFPFEPESLVGNHLMKTVVQNQYIEDNQIQALITGIRWDEQEARSQETYFSTRGDEHTPKHTRVHPILHFTEKDIWEVHHQYKIPYCSLYEQGYRSLGAKVSTHKTSDTPAWQQDLDKTTEHGGRNQDKEEIMKRLRDLGYM